MDHLRWEDRRLSQIFWGGKSQLESAPYFLLAAYIKDIEEEASSLPACSYSPLKIHSFASIKAYFFMIPAHTEEHWNI